MKLRRTVEIRDGHGGIRQVSRYGPEAATLPPSPFPWGTVLLALGLLLAGILASAGDELAPLSVPVARADRGLAHVCPLSRTVGLTARHVVEEEEGKGPLMALSFTSADGGPGVLVTTHLGILGDLAVVEAVEGQFPRWADLAGRPPFDGDRLTLARYRDDGAGTYEVTVEQRFRVGGWLQFEISGDPDKAPAPGASGSCVRDHDGQVVGILSGGRERQARAAAVWGPWGDLAHWFEPVP